MLLLQTLGQSHVSGAHARSPGAGLLCPAPAIPARHQRLSQVSSGSVVCLDPEPSFLISWSQFLLLQKNLFVDYLSAAVPLPRGLCFTRRARFLGCESDPGDLCRTHSGFSLVPPCVSSSSPQLPLALPWAVEPCGCPHTQVFFSSSFGIGPCA